MDTGEKTNLTVWWKEHTNATPAVMLVIPCHGPALGGPARVTPMLGD